MLVLQKNIKSSFYEVKNHVKNPSVAIFYYKNVSAQKHENILIVDSASASAEGDFIIDFQSLFKKI